MCGIFGFVGSKTDISIIELIGVEAAKRGPQAWGVAWPQENEMHVYKQEKKFDAKEVQLFKAVLLEGQAKGVFHIDDVEMTADLIHYCVKGIEVPYIRGHIGAHLDEDTRNKYVSNIVFGALHRTEI